MKLTREDFAVNDIVQTVVRFETIGQSLLRVSAKNIGRYALRTEKMFSVNCRLVVYYSIPAGMNADKAMRIALANFPLRKVNKFAIASGFVKQ